jgi:hypothetical protein
MIQDREIVAIRTAEARGHTHIVAVKLRDGTVEHAADAVRAIAAHHARYVMRPPEGAPAYRAHQETGLPLLVQIRSCPDCGDDMLFA